ncbi:hypothetical protein FOL46_009488 [Perkinsus olseni]|uniref:Uncharacterized protein n=1 Tax=Perkinsus olseni TaxID=32597 RepID=A0A7J6L211_PEROL|nr:hypothetical protein FOL46_009488 [Perkinsus olseni]
MPHSGFFVVLTSVVAADKFRELQFLYAHTGGDVHYLFIPDSRRRSGAALPQLRERDLIRSKHIADGVEFLQMNSYIVKAEGNEGPTKEATILRLNNHGQTREFSARVVQGKDSGCFRDVHSATPSVVGFPERPGFGMLMFNMEKASPEIESELVRVCRDGLSPILPQEGDRDLAVGDYGGAYDGKLAINMTLIRDGPPRVALRECQPGSLGTLRKVVYQKLCNFLVAVPVFKKDGITYFYRILLTPGLPVISAGNICKRSSRSYDLVEPLPRTGGPRARASCSFHIGKSTEKIHSSRMMDWDNALKLGFSVRPRGLPRRARLPSGPFKAWTAFPKPVCHMMMVFVAVVIHAIELCFRGVRSGVAMPYGSGSSSGAAMPYGSGSSSGAAMPYGSGSSSGVAMPYGSGSSSGVAMPYGSGSSSSSGVAMPYGSGSSSGAASSGPEVPGYSEI